MFHHHERPLFIMFLNPGLQATRHASQQVTDANILSVIDYLSEALGNPNAKSTWEVEPGYPQYNN